VQPVARVVNNCGGCGILGDITLEADGEVALHLEGQGGV
jgi:hypothetical protein